MGFFRWLLGGVVKDQSQSGDTARVRSVDIRESGSGFASIPELNFYGLCSHSPSGRYTLAWVDGHASQGDARDHGYGRYILLNGTVVVTEGRMQRPNDGLVANDGTFVLNDWQFQNELAGVFHIFRPDGSPILSQRFAANLFNCGLSPDGALACCQTCNAPSIDGSMLTIFDTRTGKELGRFSPESGWASEYEFHFDTQTVRLHYANGGGAFDYSLSGEFVERDRWIAAKLDEGDLYMVKRAMLETGGQPDPELARRLLASVEAGMRQPNWEDARSQALGWRLRGEIMESTGAFTDAVQCFEKAIDLDPKIGLKRHLGQLRKLLQ